MGISLNFNLHNSIKLHKNKATKISNCAEENMLLHKFKAAVIDILLLMISDFQNDQLKAKDKLI